MALVTTMVQLGNRLHITTLGEGIEDAEQLERLRALGCELGQGYLLARPVPAAEFDRMLFDGTLTPAPVASRIPAWACHVEQQPGAQQQADASAEEICEPGVTPIVS